MLSLGRDLSAIALPSARQAALPLHSALGGSFFVQVLVSEFLLLQGFYLDGRSLVVVSGVLALAGIAWF